MDSDEVRFRIPRPTKALNDLPRLREIHLESSAIADADALASLPALERLVLARTPLERIPEGAPSLPALKSLDLCATKLARLPGWVAELPALEELNVARTPLPPSELESLRARRPTLRVIAG